MNIMASIGHSLVVSVCFPLAEFIPKLVYSSYDFYYNYVSQWKWKRKKNISCFYEEEVEYLEILDKEK